MDPETPDISRLMQSQFGTVDEEFKTGQDKLMTKLCEVDMYDDSRKSEK